MNDLVCANISVRKFLVFGKLSFIFSLLCLFFCLVFVSKTVIAQPDLHIPNEQIDPGRIKERIGTEKPLGLTPPSRILNREKKPVGKATEKADVLKFKLVSVVIEGATVYKSGELQQYYQSYLNKDVSFKDLQNIANRITARYRNDGYVISRAIIPEQEIKGGIVKIEIVEGYIDQIYIEGDITKKTRSRIGKYSQAIKTMRPLQVNKLERYVLILNDISGLEVKTVLSPSSTVAKAADLIFVVEQERIMASAYYDNRGTRYLGPDQFIAMGSVVDCIGAADEFVAQTIDTPFHDELRYLQLSYGVPIGINGLRFKIDGSIARTMPGFIIEQFGLVGRSRNFSLGFEYPLIRSRAKNFWLQGEFEFLNTYTAVDSYVFFRDQIRSLRFSAMYDFVDGWRGANLFNLKFSKGLPIFGASPVAAETGISRYKGLSNYTKVNLEISRYQSIGERWVLLGSLGGQYSFGGRLLSAEEFSFGGNQFGRAYDPSELLGDSGVIGKLELRLNTYLEKRFLEQVQYYTFVEMGVLWNIGGNTYEQVAKDSGFDIGGGLRTTFTKYFHGNIEIAKPLTRGVGTQKEAGKNGNAWRLFFGIGFRM